MNTKLTRGIVRQRGPLLMAALCLVAGCPGKSSSPTFLADHGIEYWLTTSVQPRPLRIHHLRIDLANPRIELRAALAPDPDGNGPATATLESPLSLAGRSGAIAMVNANPWQSVPYALGNRSTDWHEGMAVEILGLACAGSQPRSKVHEGHCNFWIDQRGEAHIGAPAWASQVREGVAGFAQLVRDGQVVQPPGGPIHPRTALGLDRSGRRLYLVVVDGRQPGYSEGMDNHELAQYMLDLGCHDAMNLDGGGSSMMILGSERGALRVVNDPSTKVAGKSMPRPIPVALVVRPAQRKAS